MRGYIKVKNWYWDKANQECRSKGCLLVGEYVDDAVVGIVIDHTTIRVEDVLSETEKAIHILADAETFGGFYKPMNLWIPKIVILEKSVK